MSAQLIMIEPANEPEAALSALFNTAKNAGASGLRRAAWEKFTRLGLPTRRLESWRYTDLRHAMRAIAPVRVEPVAAPSLASSSAIRLVLLDGVFRPELSDLGALPLGVTARSLRETLAAEDADVFAALASDGLGGDDAIVALNAALMRDGVVLRVAPGIRPERAIELATLTSGGPTHGVYARSLVIAGEGSKFRLIERFEPLAPSSAQENLALVVSLGAGCEVEHVARVLPQGGEAIRLHCVLVSLSRGSAFDSFCMIEGGGLLRRQVFARLDGERASVTLNGVSLLRANDHADVSLFIDHAAAQGRSRENFRAILDGRATGAFQGKAVVREGAQKTDGAMQSRALLLSDNAAMNSKPELEIYADDVICGHGATCGRLDRDQLFYLETRGLPREEAEALLIEGFANEAIASVSDGAMREELLGVVRPWLSGRRAAA